jgi:tRNA (adenine57-N1/adenine58-N1)-methyltransferase
LHIIEKYTSKWKILYALDLPSIEKTDVLQALGMDMSDTESVALMEENGKIHIVTMIDNTIKIKGIGVVNPLKEFSQLKDGEETHVGSKILLRLPTRLPELLSGMKRRAQTISSKDAGVLIARHGIGADDVVLEAGLGSGGLSMHLARVIGPSGHLITVEPREEHASVGLENLQTLSECMTEFPHHNHIHGRIEEVVEEIQKHSEQVDAVLLDLPEHPPAIKAVAPLLKIGARISCYCPVTSQLEKAWIACEEAGLHVEWAGEIIERQWGKASRGGVRPVNGPFGHTAFLLLAQRRN